MDARSTSQTSCGKKSSRQRMIQGKDSHMPHTSCISLKKSVESLSGRTWSILCSRSQGLHLQEHLALNDHLMFHLLATGVEGRRASVDGFGKLYLECARSKLQMCMRCGRAS